MSLVDSVALVILVIVLVISSFNFYCLCFEFYLFMFLTCGFMGGYLVCLSAFCWGNCLRSVFDF